MPARYTIRFMLMLATALIGMIALPARAVVHEYLTLVPEDIAPGDLFGWSSDVSGSLAIVGAPHNGAGGAAYVFDTTTGQQLFKLVPEDLLPDTQFGYSVAISGTTAVISTQSHEPSGAAAYVYDLSTGSLVNKLIANDGAVDDRFGYSVAIHGTTALVGAPLDDNTYENDGSAYLFDVTTGNQLMKFVAASPAENDRLGDAVAYDGGLVAVSALQDIVAPNLLLFDPSTGTQLARESGTDGTTTGSALAIVGDRVLMGSPSVYPAATAGLYDIADVNSIITTEVPWPGGFLEGNVFGHDVDLTESAAVISTWSTDIVYLFDPDTLEVLESFQPSDAAAVDYFGWSLGLDGQTLIVGAPGDSHDQITGAAYLFIIPEPGVSLIMFTAATGWIASRKSPLL